jgi:hypothetical protein
MAELLLSLGPRRVSGIVLVAAAVAVGLVACGGAGKNASSSAGTAGHCANGAWCSQASTRYPFVVWVHGTGDSASDEAALSTTVKLLNDLWGPETALMGAPQPDVAKDHSGTTRRDDGNESSAVDVYVVQPGEPVHRDRRNARVAGSTYAAELSTATSASGAPPHAASGFLLVRRDRLGASGFKSDVAHELFHALQDAHNAGTSSDCRRRSFWFAEATATWAESYFVPSEAQSQVFDRFQTFQEGSVQNVKSWGLRSVRGVNAYSSFIWPYFMQQQRGARAIADAYKAMDGARSCDDLMHAVDAQLPFAANFRDFALRNLDDSAITATNLPPVTPRYQALHAAFPKDVRPPMATVDVPAAGRSHSESLRIPPLRAWYYELRAPSPTPVRVDASALSGAGYDLDAVTAAGGRWKVVHLATPEGTVCAGGPATDLVLSNHSSGPRAVLHGKLLLARGAGSC